MRVFIIGVSGAVGGLLAESLVARHDEVTGLVRRDVQQVALAARGISSHVAELTELTPDHLAELLDASDAVVYTAGSNGGARQEAAAVDGDGVLTALEASRLALVPRFVLLSVMPEAQRAWRLSDDEEHYFAVKKLTEVDVASSDLDWLILRPSLLVDRDGTGAVALGPAQPHDEIPRQDVAATLAELLHEPRVRRRILELTEGITPIRFAVRANVI